MFGNPGDRGALVGLHAALVPASRERAAVATDDRPGVGVSVTWKPVATMSASTSRTVRRW